MPRLRAERRAEASPVPPRRVEQGCLGGRVRMATAVGDPELRPGMLGGSDPRRHARMASPHSRHRLTWRMGCRRQLHPRPLRRRQSRRAAVPPQGDHPAARREAVDRGAHRAAAVLAAFGVLGPQCGPDTSRRCSLARTARQVSAPLPRRPRADAARSNHGGSSLPGQGRIASAPGEHTFKRNDFLARLLQHVPEPRLHQVRYYGYYSSVARARRGLR